MSSDGPAIEVAQEALEEKLDKLNISSQIAESFVQPLKQPSTKRTKSRQQRLFDEERRKQWEEAQANKPVLETGVHGTVKWYSVSEHYGFISRDDEGKDVFVHQSAISKSKIEKYFLRTLGDEERVVFDVVKGEKGPEAANVTGVNGAEVIGSKHFRIQLYRYRNNSRKRQDSVEESGEPISKSVRARVRKHKRREFRRKNNSNESETKEVSGGRRRRATDEPENEKTSIENLSAGDAGLGAQSVERQSLITN